MMMSYLVRLENVADQVRNVAALVTKRVGLDGWVSGWFCACGNAHRRWGMVMSGLDGWVSGWFCACGNAHRRWGMVMSGLDGMGIGGMVGRARFVTKAATALMGSVLVATVVAQPENILLDGEWAFKWTADAKEADAYRWFFEEGFDLSGFDTIPVPSNWTSHGFEEPHYVDGTKAEGFYVHTFDVPSEAEEMRTLLHFGGVWVSAEVWLNGVALGRHDSGFTAFAYDVSQWLKAGEENVLAVRVRQQIDGNLFKFDANDDWGLPGIYRSVWLEFMPKHLYIDRVEVETEFDELYIDADLKIRAHVFRNERDHFLNPSPPFEVRAVLRTRGGEEVVRKTVTVTIGGNKNGRDVLMTLPVQAPAQWTAETPNLYELEVEVERDGEKVHQWKDLIGFREVSTEGGVFRINGQVVKLRGVNRHDQHPDVGRATRREHWEEDIRLMKDANINAVRMAHYPHAEGFVRLCDEMGLYVLNEVPLGFGGDRLHKPIFAGGMYVRLHETVKRDRNRPSVVVWSFGNEDSLHSLIVDGVRALKGLDKTRPVLLPFRAEIETPPEVDILAPHYWSAQDYDRLAARSVRPVISTEYTHALGPDDFGQLEERWRSLTQHPSGAGAFIWLFSDQGLRRKTDGGEVFDPMENKDRYTRTGSELVRHSVAGPGEIYDSHGHLGTDGIVNPDRTPQRAYWETKAAYAPVYFPEKRVAYTPGQKEVRIPVRNEHDFLDLSSVRFEWELFGGDRLLDSGEITVEAPPRVGAVLVVPVESSVGEYADLEIRTPLYVHIRVYREDGSEMTRQGVRLGFESTPQPTGPANAGKPTVEDSAESVVVRNGPVTYVFDRESGEIAEISLGDKILADGMDLVVWRPSTFSERNRYDRRENQHDWNTYMQGLEPVLHSFEIKEQDDEVALYVRNEYRADELNAVVADMVYTVTASGTLRIQMTVHPQMDIPELPEIGIELSAGGEVEELSWLGEGPLDSLPGRTSATYFGHWSVNAADKEAEGTRYAIDWARLSLEQGGAMHVKGMEGVRLVKKSDGRYALRVLTHVAGAWTKNGPAERPEWHLELKEDAVFSGEFEIIPIKYE